MKEEIDRVILNLLELTASNQSMSAEELAVTEEKLRLLRDQRAKSE